MFFQNPVAKTERLWYNNRTNVRFLARKRGRQNDMKFFHLSDLHIGLKLMNRDLREDQEYILRQIVEMAERERPDAVIVAGDIYDKAVPPADAVELFDRFITDLTAALPGAAVMLISGNHDSAPRVNCFRSILSRQNVYMVGMPPVTEQERIERVTLRDRYGEVHFYLLPFVKPSMVKLAVGTDENGDSFSYDETVRRLIGREELDESARNVLVSHQFYLPAGKAPEEVERMDSEIRTVGNIDEVSADILERFDYAALGHIHKPMLVGGETRRYCGTPLACSVSEAGQQKGVVMVELGEKRGRGEAQIRVSVLPLLPLRQVRVVKGTLEEVLKQSCRDYVTVVLTDRVDLEVIDMQDRLRIAFPYLLEICREGLRTADYGGTAEKMEELDPFELCCSFLKDMDGEEKALLQDVINRVQEVE